jgi:hypothetical protein
MFCISYQVTCSQSVMKHAYTMLRGFDGKMKSTTLPLIVAPSARALACPFRNGQHVVKTVGPSTRQHGHVNDLFDGHRRFDLTARENSRKNNKKSSTLTLYIYISSLLLLYWAYKGGCPLRTMRISKFCRPERRYFTILTTISFQKDIK